MRLVQAVITVAPPVLILWMGGTYLLDCGRLLLAPGVPVAFDLKTADGVVRLRAAGYRLDLGERAASAWGLSARRANGEFLATVAGVEASGLDPLALRPVVRVRGVRARAVRDKTGLDLARFFPKKEGPPSTIPFSVTVTDARVRYVDLTLAKRVEQVVETDRATFDGIGDDWLGQGRIRMPGIGVANVRAQSLASVGVTADVCSDALRLTRFAPLALPGLKIGSLVARGPVRVDVPKGRDAAVAAVLTVEARDVRYQRYALDAATFTGRASAAGGQGVVLARLGGVRARFEGSATLKQGGGQAVVKVPSRGSLPAWVQAYLPAKTDFRGAGYAGWVGWQGKRVVADGLARAERASYGPDSVDEVTARVAYSPERVDLRGLSLRWKGAPLAGDASYEIGSRAIRAAVVAPRLELGLLAQRLGNASGVSGTVGGQALVSGTAAEPRVEGRVSGRVAFQGRSLGDVEARGAWLAGAARVDRLKVSGPLGAIVAGGTVRPDGTLDFKAEARGLRIERLYPDAQGLVSANLRVGGTLRDPQATGRLEAYRLAYGGQTLPAAGFDLAADRRRIDLTLFTAVRGTTRVAGRVGASLVGPGVTLSDPRSWLLDGQGAVTGIQLGEIPGVEAIDDVAGLLSVPRIELKGRLGNPVVSAELAGEGLIVRGVRIDSVQAKARADRRGAVISDLKVLAAGGAVTGGGLYSLAKGSGDIDLTVSDLQLSRLLNDLSEDVIVEGTLSAPRVHLALRDGKPVGTAEGSLNAVTVNGVLAGDGNWSLDATGSRIKAEASVGRLDPTLRALDASGVYDVEVGSIAATVQAKDVPLAAVVAAVEAKRQSSEAEAARLASIGGDLSGTVSIVRTREGLLKVDATDLQAAMIRYMDLDYGTLTASSLVRRGDRWSVEGGLLVGPEGRFEASGWVEEDGDLNVRATGSAVKVSAFSPFAPDLAQFTGVARFDLAATGGVRKPTVVGSAGIDNLFAVDGRERLSLSLNDLSVKDGKSSVRGVLRYGARFGGLLSLSTDWAYREPIREAGFEAQVDLGSLTEIDAADPTKGFRVQTVALADVPGLAAYIDRARTRGDSLGGSFAATGTFGKPRLTGGINLRADRLGILVPGGPITRVDDTLKDVRVDLGFDKRNAPLLTASVGFSRGGTLTALGTLGDLEGQNPFDLISKTRDWKGLPIAGDVEIKDASKVTVRQTIGGAETTATVAGRLNVSGKAVAPRLSGSFVISNLDATLPTLAESTGDSAVGLLDPSFDLTVALAQAGRFHTATADIYLTGDLSLKGALSDPVATAELVTDRGSIRLPGGNVRVDKGGQISFAYRRPLSGGTPASASIDLQGRSQLTLARNGTSTPQRYDITLDIQGDLLRDNGLRFDATSDPGDLTKDEILTALGGTDLISGVAAGGSSAERNVRNAFAGFALPGLLDPYTNKLATLAGFEYVNFDYNAYDQATIIFGRSLGPDFSFQGRQQVGTPTPGYRSIYDLRLSFNPRRILPKLSRLSFTLGTDQDRPWKTSVEFGTRFGGRKGPAKPRHVIFSSKP